MQATGFDVDHFIYRVERAMRGRNGRCGACGVAFRPGDTVRIAADLADDGYWHEICPAGEGSE